MKFRLAAIILVLLAALWWLTTSRNPKIAARSAGSPPAPANAALLSATPPANVVKSAENADADAAPDATSDPAEKLPGPIPATPKRPALAAAEEPPQGPEVGPGLPPLTVLENVRSVFRQYNQRFGGNPVGNNLEITAALNGGNPRQVVFLNPDDGLRVNGRGQLVDNWGTPFFFHQLSRTEMEIYSAGPDRKMWTRDDLVIR